MLMLRPTILFGAFILGACSQQESTVPDQQSNQIQLEMQAAPELVLGSGIDLEYMDKSIAPGDDFYRYVNGTWLANTEIPADQSNYGAFSVLADEAEEHLRTLIEEAAATDAAIGSDSQKVGDFYQSFMNENLIENLGSNPLAASLAEIVAVTNKD